MEMLSLTKTRSLWIFLWQVLVWNPLLENFQDTSAISIRLYHWHLFFSSFVNKLLQAYMSYVFLFPFLQPISFISSYHNRYHQAHAAGKDPIHPSINLFRPSCLACHRKGHPTSTFLKSPSSSAPSGQGQDQIHWCGWNFCNLEWMGHKMVVMKGMIKFQTRKEYIPQVRQKGCWLLKISFTMDWKPSSLFVAAV